MIEFSGGYDATLPAPFVWTRMRSNYLRRFNCHFTISLTSKVFPRGAQACYSRRVFHVCLSNSASTSQRRFRNCSLSAALSSEEASRYRRFTQRVSRLMIWRSCGVRRLRCIGTTPTRVEATSEPMLMKSEIENGFQFVGVFLVDFMCVKLHYSTLYASGLRRSLRSNVCATSQKAAMS